MFKFNFLKKPAGKEDTRKERTPNIQVPTADLFVDDTPPRSDQKAYSLAPEPTKLAAFLSKDYWNSGKRDGYLYHSAESFEIWRRKTKAEFQLVMDHMIQEKREQRFTLLNHITGIGTLHENTVAQLHNTIRELDADIDRLTTQKELSAVDEGWIMNAFHGYQLGFNQGLKEYVEGEDLLKNVPLF